MGWRPRLVYIPFYTPESDSNTTRFCWCGEKRGPDLTGFNTGNENLFKWLRLYTLSPIYFLFLFLSRLYRLSLVCFLFLFPNRKDIGRSFLTNTLCVRSISRDKFCNVNHQGHRHLSFNCAL